MNVAGGHCPTALIIGAGVATCIGVSIDAYWSALVSGRSGTRAFVPPGDLSCAVAARVDEIPVAPVDPLRPGSRVVQLARHAALCAWQDASVAVDRERIGLVVGTALGNMDVYEQILACADAGRRVSPLAGFRGFTHAAACELGSALDIRGPMLTVSTGCNSGADAVGIALDWLRLAKADVVLVGGVDAELTRGFLAGMNAARALTRRHNARPDAASRPFDLERDGNVPGEGAAFLVLSRIGAGLHARAPYASLTGFAGTAAGSRPPYDPFDPPDAFAPILRNMQRALLDAGIHARDLSAISANGSSSTVYDRLEALAIAALTDPTNIPVHSIKGHLGQTGAVSAALQILTAALSVDRQSIPPTINVTSPDPSCPITLVQTPTSLRLEHVLCHAIGFGGAYHASTVVSRAG